MTNLTRNRSIRLFTVFLFIASFWGSRVLTVDIGVVISPIRIGLFLTPIFYLLSTQDNLKLGNKSNVFRFLVFWMLYSLLIIFFTVDFAEYARHFFFLLSASIISYFASLYLTEEKDFRIILSWFEFFAVVYSLIGVYEIITGDYRFISDNSIDRYRDSSALFSTIGIRVPTGSFANPNDFGFFLLFAFCISFALRQLRTSKIGKHFSMLCTFLFVFMIVATQSRAAFMSLLLGFFVLVVLNFHRMKKGVKVLLIIFSLASFSYIVAFLTVNKDLFEALLELDVSSNADGSDRTRLNLISNGLKMLINHGGLGVGLGQIESHMIQYGNAATYGITNIHNWWAEVLVSSGIIVFLYYIKLFFSTAVFFCKQSFSSTLSREGCVYARLGASLLTVFFLGCMSPSSIFCIEWIWAVYIYWMLLYRVIK